MILPLAGQAVSEKGYEATVIVPVCLSVAAIWYGCLSARKLLVELAAGKAA